MSEFAIPDDVRKFLSHHVRSITQLEILLLLSGSPQRYWTAHEAYRVLLSNEELVGKTLETFSGQGLVRQSETGAYQFSPASDDVKRLVKTLAELYRERPNRIIQVIYEGPIAEIKEFAKAFKLRKEP